MTISLCIDLMLQPCVDHLGGQPFEQLGVRGSAAVEPEIAGRLDQARSEVCLPETVDHDPREERVLRAGNPRCQPLAPPGLGRVGRQAERGPGCDDRRDSPRRHRVTGLVGVAPHFHAHRARLSRRHGVCLACLAGER